MDASIQQKQQFLRVQILQTGYDPEDFIEFMSTHSQIQSPTIQTLTLPQLQSIVSAYKQQVKKRNIQAQKEKNSQQTAQKQNQPPSAGKGDKKIFTPQKMKNYQQRKNKIQYDKYGTFDFELKGTVNCIQADKLTIVQKIEISIPEFQTKQTQGYLFGLGAKVQYYYHIKSNLMKGTVKRLSEDFDWLSSTLLRLYPFLVVIQSLIKLPQLESVRKDIKQPYVRRQKDIQQYLQHLSQKKYLTHSYVFIDFLTLSTEKMQKYKKSYDSMGFAKGVSLLKTPDGVVQMQLSNRSRQLYQSSKQFSRKTSLLHENLSLAITKMIQSYRTAILDTYSVVDMFAQLHDVFGQIGNKFPTLKKQQYNDTLVNLNNLFLGIGDNLKNMADTVQRYTKDYYRFYNGLDKNLQKLQKLVKQSENQYLQFKNNLQRKKQRVISDPTKWDIDNRDVDIKKLSKQQLMKYILPKQVLAENQLKFWYAFNLKNYQQQLMIYLRFITKRYQKVFRTLAVQLLSDDKIYLQSITKFISDGRKVGSHNTTVQSTKQISSKVNQTKIILDDD